jgi:hypothetical protein
MPDKPQADLGVDPPRRPLLPAATVTAVVAVCLVAASVRAWAAPERYASGGATVIILATGAASSVTLAIAALVGRARSSAGPGSSAWRLVWASLVVLGVGLFIAIATATADSIRIASPVPALIAIWSATIVCLIVLFHHRWIRRRLR